MEQRGSLKERTKAGVIWSGLSTFSNQGLSFIFGIILARLLTPSDYGIIALLMVFISVISIFVDSGFSVALIRKEEKKKEDFDTEFYFNIIVGACCYCFLFVLAPYIADFYDIPLLNPILKVLSIKLILQSFIIVQTAIFSINLDFKTPALIGLISNAISGLCGICFAYCGFGIWALVIQQITGQAIMMLALWVKSSWRPSLRFSNESFQYMFDFGSKMIVSSLIQTIYNNLYPLLIGGKFGAIDVGLYSRANHLAQFPSANISTILNNVTFPILSKINKDEQRVIEVYNNILKTVSYVVFPVMIIIAINARPLVLLLLGNKWESCIVLLQILCFAFMWQPISSINQSVLKVVNRPDMLLRLELIKRPIGVIVVLSSLYFGMIGVCIGTILIYLIAFVADNTYASKALNISKAQQFGIFVPFMINSIIMGIFAIVPMFMISSVIYQILFSVLVAMCYLLLTSRHFFRATFANVMILMRNKSL